MTPNEIEHIVLQVLARLTRGTVTDANAGHVAGAEFDYHEPKFDGPEFVARIERELRQDPPQKKS